MMTRKPRAQLKDESVVKLKHMMANVGSHGEEVENCIEARGYLMGLRDSALFHGAGGEAEFARLQAEIAKLIKNARERQAAASK